MFSQSFSTVYGSTHGERTYSIDGMDITWTGSEGFVISYLASDIQRARLIKLGVNVKF